MTKWLVIISLSYVISTTNSAWADDSFDHTLDPASSYESDDDDDDSGLSAGGLARELYDLGLISKATAKARGAYFPEDQAQDQAEWEQKNPRGSKTNPFVPQSWIFHGAETCAEYHSKLQKDGFLYTRSNNRSDYGVVREFIIYADSAARERACIAKGALWKPLMMRIGPERRHRNRPPCQVGFICQR